MRVTTAQLVYGLEYVLPLQGIMVWFLARPRYLALLSRCICHRSCPTELVHQQINRVQTEGLHYSGTLLRIGSSILWITTLHKTPIQSPHSSHCNTVITICRAGNNFTQCTGGVLLMGCMLPVCPSIALGTHINSVRRMFLTTYLPRE